MWKRELVVLLKLSSWRLATVIVLRFFLRVPWVCLQCVIVVFPGHSRLYFRFKVQCQNNKNLVINFVQQISIQCFDVSDSYFAHILSTVFRCKHWFGLLIWPLIWESRSKHLKPGYMLVMPTDLYVNCSYLGPWLSMDCR